MLAAQGNPVASGRPLSLPAIMAFAWNGTHSLYWVILGATVFVVGYAWVWLIRRHPMVAVFILGFLRGLLGSRQ